MYGRALLVDSLVSLEGVSSGLLGAMIADGTRSSHALGCSSRVWAGMLLGLRLPGGVTEKEQRQPS